ncbi:ABC transporter permease [Frondihabitans australicus]|uniref:ABC-2 type transport system permease protein n=1 Tax=Frondihabitans australicus TaxID=386892 RepID=A0A495IK10_9MICO|nr:ABC transporter permease [Frondihabitans australicus]RKR76060.1 ABC-2 type transport system permease protein [Frondihabitans australicus]
MARYNLRTVIGFEVTRTLTKRRFWIATLIVPVIIGIVVALIAASDTSTDSSISEQKNAKFSFSYTDASGIVNPEVVRAVGGHPASSPSAAIAAVKKGTLDAYFDYPANPVKQDTKVYGVDKGIFDNGQYTSVASEILKISAEAKVGDAKLSSLVQGTAPTTSTTYNSAGQVSGGIGSVIPPLLFLAIFYVVILLLANQMLTSTLEEKENRVTEMILTTLNPTTLIIGKIISLFIVGVVQMVVFALPVVIGYLFFRTSLNLPALDLAHLHLAPWPMVAGALMLIGGFTLFTGTLVAVGAIMPTAKEAGQIFGVMMALIFVPFYAVALIVSDPHALIVQIFTFFPYSAPVTAMLRNGLGSLDPVSAVIVIAEQFILGGIVLRLAVRLFRYGSIEYSRKVSLRTILPARARRDDSAASGAREAA